MGGTFVHAYHIPRFAFVRSIMQGRVGSYEGCPANNTDCLEPILGVQLVR